MVPDEIERYAGSILHDQRFQKLRSFEHHGPSNTVYDHSIAVTCVAYRIACALHLSEDETASVVRAALLHDFFGYDWHSEHFRRFAPLLGRPPSDAYARLHPRSYRRRPRKTRFRSVRPRMRSHRAAYVPPRAYPPFAYRVDCDPRGQGGRVQGSDHRRRRLHRPRVQESLCMKKSHSSA